MNRLFAVLTIFAGLSNAASGPAKGTLVIVGGGQVGPEIVEQFVSLAGGTNASFVVFPTAGEDSQIDLTKTRQKFMEHYGVKNVVVLHTRNRAEADTAQFAAPLRSASAVWFEGGRQWRLADSYLGTRTEQEIRALLDRGGVVGGSSAGATIQGSYLVRGATENNTIMMSPGHEKGLGLMTGVAIDQHVIKRHREKDLDAVIEAHPELLGIGIDESTAIVVTRDQFRVIGVSKVLIHDGKDHDGNKFYYLSRGETYGLRRP